MIQTLQTGIQEKRMVKIVYKNPQGDIRYRQVDPYKMNDKKLYGYCHVKNQPQIFNLEDILSVQLTNKRYEDNLY
ncbi:WYL domain-containing protein [Selenihalanaerobacter shriftii]|uniref:WYL domain-containing protein n=1 Tax=Selenihalanaerobacter shriftii TaxID=142842 RepID=A0A1T4JMD1_9FIRM|nr:WYL domain-containing protein [Selenihalanaerobacter shriftii]SJZ31332.1 WYL domain-containing protein [Selenihalanaerobacter shriftii]